MSTLRVNTILPLTGTTVTISGSLNVATASFATTAATAATATTASFATTAATATTASFATTASYAANGGGGGGDFENIDSDVLPSFDSVYDLGSSAKKWYDLNIGNSVKLGDSSSISIDADNDIIINSNTVVQGTLSSSTGSFGDITIEGNKLVYEGSGYQDAIEVDQNLSVNSNLKVANNNAQINLGYNAGVWSAGGNLNHARADLGGVGTQNAALAFGGTDNFGTNTYTEEYNGISWTDGPQINFFANRTGFAGAGTQNAALSFGGLTGDSFLRITQKYNGVTWATANDMINGVIFPAGAGTQNAALSMGGMISSVSSNNTEEYNGTSWSAGGNLAVPRQNAGGAGTQTAALTFGGESNFSVISSTEEYNGTSWSTGGNMLTSKDEVMGTGTQTAALTAGGVNSTNTLQSSTEEYDGTSWSAGGNLLTATHNAAGAGTQASALFFGGYTTYGNDASATTMEYNKTSYSTFNLTGSIILSPATSTLPSGSEGQLAVSGSNLYFYSGSDWRQVSLV
jgi:hypothetical protein